MESFQQHRTHVNLLFVWLISVLFQGTRVLSLSLSVVRTDKSQGSHIRSIQECLEAYHANTTKIQFVDATWFHKGDRNGRDEFKTGPRLPNAIHWDIGEFSSDHPKGLKNVFPSEDFVGRALEQMGVENSTTLVVYGRKGTLFAPRVWYMLHKYFLGGPVFLMQGSLEDWIEQGGPVDSIVPLRRQLLAKDSIGPEPSKLKISQTARDRLVDKKFVLEHLKDTVIIDTRGSSFLKNGHIPGSVHIPYASLCSSSDPLTLKPLEELKEILVTTLGKSNYEGLKENPPLLTCGTGVSVCTMALVLSELNLTDPWIYDGSWNEWGQDPSTPKVHLSE